MRVYYITTIYLIFLIVSGAAGSDRDSIRKEQGKLMKMYMNSSADPCDDFYNYACGNWAQHNPNVEKKHTFGVLHLMTNNVNSFLKETILKENLTQVSNEKVAKILSTDIVKKIRTYYSLCLEKKEPKYDKYLEEFNLPGGWAGLNTSWSKESFDWLNATAHLKLFDIVSLFDVTVGPHYSNASRNIIYISSPDFPVFRRNEYLYQRSKMVQRMMVMIITNGFVELGVNKTDADSIAREVLKFETELARISPSETEDGDPEEMSLDTLFTIIPEINWKKALDIISGQDFNSSQIVAVLSRPYLMHLVTLLENTQPEVIANFLLYRFLLNIGITSSKINEYCTNEVITHMGSVLGSIYIQAYNDDESNADIEQIVRNIQTAFADAIEKTDWMENSTIAEALQKLNTILPKIGASEEQKSNDIFTKEFHDLELDSENYCSNYFRLLAYTTRKSFKTLNKVNSRNEWNYNPATVNAFYDTPKNFILIPTSILQTPLYNINFPKSVKYGGLGTIIGHELTHSLDASGREFDANGVLRNWWTSQSTEEYTNRTECLIAQYDKYLPMAVTKNTSIESTTTLDENIADNGGIRHSFQAYMNWLHENGGSAKSEEDETLPELNLSNKQLFFLSFAQFYCQSVKMSGVIVGLLMDEHTSNKYRVIGTLSNFDEFSKVYQCPVGSPMNPNKKCKIW